MIKDRKKDLHVVFIDLGKVYGRVPREVLWRCLEKKDMLVDYIRVIKNMYDEVRTRVLTSGGVIDEFFKDIGLHQGSTLSAFSFYYCYQ